MAGAAYHLKTPCILSGSGGFYRSAHSAVPSHLYDLSGVLGGDPFRAFAWKGSPPNIHRGWGVGWGSIPRIRIMNYTFNDQRGPWVLSVDPLGFLGGSCKVLWCLGRPSGSFEVGHERSEGLCTQMTIE